MCDNNTRFISEIITVIIYIRNPYSRWSVINLFITMQNPVNIKHIPATALEMRATTNAFLQCELSLFVSKLIACASGVIHYVTTIVAVARRSLWSYDTMRNERNFTQIYTYYKMVEELFARSQKPSMHFERNSQSQLRHDL